MAQENKAKGTLRKLMDNEKARKWIIIAGLAAVVLIFLSGYLKLGGEAESEAAPETEEAVMTSDEYAAALEQKLASIVNAITGDGSAQVLVTMERGAELVYATEEKKKTQTSDGKRSDDTETSYIIVKNSDGSQTALSVAKVEPVVKGVVVVCPRGDEAVVKQNIVDALSTVLGISSARVCVLSANQ